MEILRSDDLPLTAIANQHYVEILEKTNQQLGLWTNPYGLMVGALSFLVAFLAIAASVILYKQSSDHKKQTKEERKNLREELTKIQKDFLNKLQSRTEDQLRLYDEKILEKEKNAHSVHDTDFLKGIPLNVVIKSQGLGFLYWRGSNGNRFSFPTEDVFLSWFPASQFRPAIFNLTDAQVVAIPLAGSVLYKAGTRLIKLSSDPKIFAVGNNGSIHWIPSEGTIEKIFGYYWRNILVTIPDVLFVNYSVGRVIESPQDFDPEQAKILDKLP